MYCWKLLSKRSPINDHAFYKCFYGSCTTVSCKNYKIYNNLDQFSHCKEVDVLGFVFWGFASKDKVYPFHDID